MKRGHSREAVFEWNGDAIVAVENVKINESEKQRVKSEKRQSVLNMQDTVRKMLNGASAFRKRIVKQFSGRSSAGKGTRERQNTDGGEGTVEEKEEVTERVLPIMMHNDDIEVDETPIRFADLMEDAEKRQCQMKQTTM